MSHLLRLSLVGSIGPIRYDTDQVVEAENELAPPKLEGDCFRSSRLAAVGVDLRRASHKVEELVEEHPCSILDRAVGRIRSYSCPLQD